MSEWEYLPGEPEYRSSDIYRTNFKEINDPETRSRLIQNITARVTDRIRFLAHPQAPIAVDEDDYLEPNYSELRRDIDFLFGDPRKFIARDYRYAEEAHTPESKDVDLTIYLARDLFYHERFVAGGSNLTPEEGKQIVEDALKAAGFASEEAFKKSTMYYDRLNQ